MGCAGRCWPAAARCPSSSACATGTRSCTRRWPRWPRAAHRRALGIILSSFRTEASWERYLADVAAARERTPGAPEIVFAPPWFEHPRFVAAVADGVERALAEVPAAERADTPVLFTAHSVPAAMAAASPYVADFTATARAVAARLGHARWSLAYQSRSGSPRDPWLEPDVGDAIRALAKDGAQHVVVSPAGFVCDHVEVLYDLDVEARWIAAEARRDPAPRLRGERASGVHRHAGRPRPGHAVRLLVVGGGIAGLSAAHRAVEIARERGIAVELTLVEARERLGGSIASERTDGFLVEAGPDSFLSEKPWALALCRRLGIEDRLVRTDDRFRKVFVWHRGRLHPLPDGFQLLAPTAMLPFATSSLFSLTGKLRMALDLVLPRGGGDDESLGAFVRRRLGAEALERVAQPLVAGIYTADPDDLSLTATMPRFIELERTQRSVILGLRRGVAPGSAARHQRRPLVALRHLRPRDGGAGDDAGGSAAGGSRRAEAAGERGAARGRALAGHDGGGRSLRGRPGHRRHRGPRHGAAGPLSQSRAGHAAGRDPVRLGGDGVARLPARGRARTRSTASASWCRAPRARRCWPARSPA